MARVKKLEGEADEAIVQETTETQEPKTEESVYSIDQLINGYKAFRCNRDLVVVALKLNGKDTMTFSEAERIIEDFKNKEVK